MTSDEDKAGLTLKDSPQVPVSPQHSILSSFEVGSSMADVLEEIKRKAKEHNEWLRREAKPYEALIISVEAIVESVLGNTASIYARSGPLVMGGSNPTYKSGTAASLEITIAANPERLCNHLTDNLAKL